MNYTNEALFLLLAGFAKESYKQIEEFNNDSKLQQIIKVVNKHFKKNKKKYNPTQSKIIMDLIENKAQKIIDELSPISMEIMLVLALDHLLNEARHIEARIYFQHLDLKTISDSLETGKYRNEIFKHRRCLIKLSEI